ncbi:MAG: cation-translocating P-type ATPase [Candidatus Binatia bacterium]
MNWHLCTIDSVLSELKTHVHNGLSSGEARARLSHYGANELIEKGGRSPLQIIWEQLTATMVLILVAAAALAALLGDFKNAIAIIAIVMLFTVLGFVQEYRAEKAIAALKKLSVPNVRVRRDGTVSEVPARDLVPGDIVLLEAGNVVPADVRLIESNSLRVQEAALTGESEPIEKRVEALSGNDLPLGDRHNMAYTGTIVTFGRALAAVVATGMATELGKIANLLQQTTSNLTPLQRRLDKLGKILAGVGAAIAALIAMIGLFNGDELRHMLLTAVSVAVAIVPEGLPAVVTITLALGAQRMLKRKALIRKLPAVETLGSVTVICSDKTGTLTENKMSVVVMDVAEHELDLTEWFKRDSVRTQKNDGHPAESSLSLLAMGGALCNDASFVEENQEHCHTIGDPTEGALIAAAAQMGYWKSSLDASFPRSGELPFDSDRKRMTTIHHLNGNRRDYAPLAGFDADSQPYIAFTKGSVDGLLTLSSHVWNNGKAEAISESWRQRIEGANDRLAKKGMRVLGVAYRNTDRLPRKITEEFESELTFVGLFGMIDPPRAEVKDSIRLTKSAGLRTVMITGDHPLTAAEIARQLGISDSGDAMTGREIDKLSFDELKEKVDAVRVFARVSPEHKLKIVQALQEKGHIVSMTGDGVNDAPALRRADIGVAMGITGTDVSKEASDLVLLDDNFSTIVAAIQEGRTIYDNLRKFVSFSVAGNIGKVLVMLIAPFLGKPIPLLPLQLLWLNLLTDGLLGLGLGVEPAEKNLMRRPPFSPTEGIFSRGAAWQTIWIGSLIGLLCLGVGSWYFFGGHGNWQTMVFTSLAFAQIGQALAVRSGRDSLFTVGLRSNGLMLGMVIMVFILQALVIYTPPLQSFFETDPLSPLDLLVAVGMGVMVFAAIELEKLWHRRTTKLL